MKLTYSNYEETNETRTLRMPFCWIQHHRLVLPPKIKEIIKEFDEMENRREWDKAKVFEYNVELPLDELDIVWSDLKRIGYTDDIFEPLSDIELPDELMLIYSEIKEKGPHRITANINLLDFLYSLLKNQAEKVADRDYNYEPHVFVSILSYQYEDEDED